MPASTPKIEDAAASVQPKAPPHQLQEIPIPPIVAALFHEEIGRVRTIGGRRGHLTLEGV
jgi:hypothetical protein